MPAEQTSSDGGDHRAMGEGAIGVPELLSITTIREAQHRSVYNNGNNHHFCR